jgi:lambda family phage portal protein
VKKKAAKAPSKVRVVNEPLSERTYKELASIGGQNSDWGLSLITEDSEIWQNAWALTSRVRDLFRCNPLYQAYRETLWANVLGSNGITLRMTIKEQDDRIVSTPERKFLEAYHERKDAVLEFMAKQQGREFVKRQRMRVLGTNGSRVAQVKVGEPDIFANTMIEKAWAEWQRMENCDVRGTRNYKTIRQLRLISAVRDGDFFIRMVRDRRVNKFGFTLHMINAEWCDRFYNDILTNGNVVRMGIEYQFSPWGLGKPVAYYFIKRQPSDWQFSVAGGFNFSSGNMHERIDADEIIHYSRAVDAESTRPAPWVCSTIPSSRQRDQAMLAEVIAWRESATRTGVYYSDVMAEGMGELVDPKTKIKIRERAPGDKEQLPYGWKYQDSNPMHPNTSVKEFRMASIQDGCAGMPGANYSTMANDYAAINFSAGQLQRLDTNETNMLLQDFDIEYGENRVFEAWLQMAMITGAVPLPVQKFDKFNSKVFAGRRWGAVDEIKNATASALRVANHQSNDFIECAARSLDFAEVMEGQAEANMIKEMYGIKAEKTVESGGPKITDAPDVEEGDTTATAGGGDTPAKKKPAKKPARK